MLAESALQPLGSTSINTALRLLVALNRALGETTEPTPVDQLRSEVNLDDGSEEDT